LKILILDITHGGDVLAEEYASRGSDVTVVDVYKTSSPSLRERMKEKGVRFLSASPAETFDLLISPIHCPDRFIGEAKFQRRITSHQAAGELSRFSYPIIEVTGTRGKTSTCHLLAHILGHMGKKVLLNSSRGLYEYDSSNINVKSGRTSIAPPHIIPLTKNGERYDYGILEISLGGTGVGDVSVITSIGSNYPIAGGTRSAFDGKSQMGSLAKGTVVYPSSESSLWHPLVPEGRKEMTFGAGGDVSISIPKDLTLGEPAEIAVTVSGTEYRARFPGSFLAPSYSTALAASLAVVKSLDLELSKAMGALPQFNGVPGRGEVWSGSDRFLIRERNPGVSAESIKWNVDMLQEHYGVKRMALVVDPVNRRICEKLDFEALDALASQCSIIDKAFLLNANLQDQSFKKLIHITDASNLLEENEVVLWCTKEGFQ